MSSLDELWEDESLTVVSAKQTIHKDENPISTKEQEDGKASTHMNNVLESLLFEISELRKEQTKRSSVYMIMLGILFALLILYIDRLNMQIKLLKSH
tara:strand:- start:2088 stop:2378 length:291 start_codon:yes stop_codon:yes gene_type:complete